MPSLVSGSIPLLLCSLGNPGKAYAHTRHNAGHILLDLYRRSMRLPDYSIDDNGLRAVSSGSLYLIESNTYMNTSGTVVAKARSHFLQKHPSGRLCVIHDELETAHGQIKLRHKGRGKGHNGVRSCIQHLGTEDFSRMAIGIGRPASRESSIVSGWVLGRFTREEMKVLQEDTLADFYTAIDQLRRPDDSL